MLVVLTCQLIVFITKLNLIDKYYFNKYTNVFSDIKYY